MRLAALLQDLTFADELGLNDSFSKRRIDARDPELTAVTSTAVVHAVVTIHRNSGRSAPASHSLGRLRKSISNPSSRSC